MWSAVQHSVDIFSAGNMVRGSGMAAYILLFLVVAGGMMISLKLPPIRWRGGFLVYHRLITIAAMVMLLIHGLAFFIDKYQMLSWADVLIPFWIKRHSGEIAAGIIAVYTMGIITGSSHRSVMKSLGWEKWRKIHYLAFPCYWIALYHSVTLSKSSNALFLSFFYPATAGIVIALTGLRIWRAVERRKSMNEHSVG